MSVEHELAGLVVEGVEESHTATTTVRRVGSLSAGTWLATPVASASAVVGDAAHIDARLQRECQDQTELEDASRAKVETGLGHLVTQHSPPVEAHPQRHGRVSATGVNAPIKAVTTPST